MTSEEKREKHAAYMREYIKKNKDRIYAMRKERAQDPQVKAKKLEHDAAYRKRKKEEGFYQTEKYREYMALKQKEYRQKNPNAARATKQRYYSSEKGKVSKKREDAAYVASGGRLAAEARRALKPISEARKAARQRWAKANTSYFTAIRSKRRCLEKNLSNDDFWILQEAVELARLREIVVGGKWHVDHVVPVSKGGTSEPHNIQVVPASWNMKKSNKHSKWFFTRA